MALDYGARTVGVACTDSLGLTAQAVETVWRKREDKLRRTLARIEQIAGEREIRRIIVGLPLNMDDSEGERAKRARAFADQLARRTGLPVEMYDERLSTVEADEILEECGVAAERRKEHIDVLSAQLILERYMDDLRQ
mgnify:CR=1 FL=1